MTPAEAIALVRSKASGRTRYEGQRPFLDEVLVAEIEQLTQELAACRRALRMVYAKAVRHKYNPHWHEITLTGDQMAAILEAATETPHSNTTDVTVQTIDTQETPCTP